MKKNLSVLLLFLSLYKRDKENSPFPELRSYALPDSSRLIEGYQTFDAPLEYLLGKAHENKDDIKHILCICSYDVMTDKRAPSSANSEDCKDCQLTTFQYFKDVSLKNTCERLKIEMPEVIPVAYDYEKNGEENVRLEKPEKQRIAARIFAQINEFISSQKEEQTSDENRFYIDYTGGLRDISFLMTSIIRFLDFENIHCKEIIYSEINPNRIHDIKYIYKMFSMIEGIDEFVSSGSAGWLNREFSGYETDGDIKELLDAIVEFSKKLSICDVANLDGEIFRLDGLTKKISERKEGPDSLHQSLMNAIMPLIREKMRLDSIVTESKIDYCVLTKWCVDHGLILQAAAVYNEKMPRYYCDHCPAFYSGKNNPEDYFNHGVFEKILKEKIKEKAEPFAELLKQIKDEFEEKKKTAGIKKPDDKRNLWIKVIEEFKSKEDNKGCINLLTNIENIIKEDELLIRVDGENQKAGNSSGDFINNLINNSYWTYILACNYTPDAPYSYYKNESYSVDEKYDIVHSLKEDLGEEITKILKDYLAIKVIRNSIAHVHDAKSDPYYTIGKKLLENDKIDTTISFDTIKQLLDDVLNKELKKKAKR